jgi:hypothetical protein
MLIIAKRGGRYRVWNQIEALRIEVEEGIEECGQKRQYRALNEISQYQSRQRRAKEIEECRRGLRRASYSRQAPLGVAGCNEAAPPWVI